MNRYYWSKDLKGVRESTAWRKNISGKGTRRCKGQCGNTHGDKCLWNREHMKEDEKNRSEGIKTQVALILLLLFDCLVPIKMFLIYDIILGPFLLVRRQFRLWSRYYASC